MRFAITGFFCLISCFSPCHTWCITGDNSQQLTGSNVKSLPLILIVLICLAGPLPAKEKPLSDLSTFQLFFENDLFGETDKYYTNAVQFTWLSSDLKKYKDDVRLPEWTLPVIKAIPFSATPNSIHNVGILLGQHIYTPSDIQETGPQPDDRPYAGFLYTGLALHSKTATVLDTLEIAVGLVGPKAFAEFSQNTVHEARDIPTAKGWDHQLHTEPALRLSWQRKWRMKKGDIIGPLEYDLISHAGITLGNVRVSGDIGGEVRLGLHLPEDFGSDTIRPGAGVSTPALTHEKKGKHRYGAHLFAGTRAEVVGHDLFLDGNTFQDSPGVEKEKLVFDISGGIALIFDRYKFTYRHLYRTKQFTDQRQPHIIGSLTLTISY